MMLQMMTRIASLLKKILITLFMLLVFCEVVIYYVVLLQCSWPVLEVIQKDKSTNENVYPPLKVMLLADTHLLGSVKGHWFDKLRREWQMYRAFQTSITIHSPDVVFVLGDIFDEGLWCKKKEFMYYINRFHSLFHVPEKTMLYVVPGNHDMGFHYWVTGYLKERFEKAFNISAVSMLNIHGNIFILLNSMAMEGDNCFLCRSARYQLNEIAKKLAIKLPCDKHNEAIGICQMEEKSHKYTRPIFLQHFPMYRLSDEVCNEPDSAHLKEKLKPFREKWECLSKDATSKLLKLLKPRAIFTGHTHFGCHLIHNEDIHEWTLPSFNWRNTNDPSFALAIFTPDSYAVNKCYMPRESTVIGIYIFGLIFLIVWIFHSKMKMVKLYKKLKILLVS